MGIQDLQTFLDSNCVPSGVVAVDLLKIARQVIQRQRNRTNKNHQHSSNTLKLVLDGECCLDRLYGGYFSDWASGGQWNRMVQFLAALIQQTEMYGIELVVFLNGCNETERRAEWIKSQLDMRNKVNNVLKHITTKGTPPPKIWWIPPVCLRTSLRMALRHLKITIISSVTDHHHEIITYCRDKNFAGIIADDAEYIAFDPPRYFSSEQLKLTYKNSLETKEYIISEVIKSLGIQNDRICILIALLGNFILTDYELNDFYKKLSINNTGPNKTNIDQSIKIIAGFVKDLPSRDIDIVIKNVFESTNDPRCCKLRKSIQYYIDGTKDGYYQQKIIKNGKNNNNKQQQQQQQNVKQTTSTIVAENSTETTVSSQDDDTIIETTSKFASETIESEQESLNAYNQATANAKIAPQIVIEPPVQQLNNNNDSQENIKCNDQHSTNGHATVVNGTQNNLINNSSSSSGSSSATSPSHNSTVNKQSDNKPASIPTSVPEVMRTAIERHQKGLMSPDIYQILVTGEIKLPVLLEDDNHREFPSIHLIYRPIRQMIYAILFNLNHKIYLATKGKNEKDNNERIEVPDVVIKEWIWSKGNPYQTPDYVKAEKIGWGVPTIQRLWFGSGIDDKRRRLRGFLTCMKSDTPMMLNISYVPQHLLVMACVLRYIMSFSDKNKILRRQELDAFIAQAFSPDLMNAQYLQDLQLPLVTFRGVQLATLFMAGVETALMANDACGAPIPWLMCCPWLYFDGKLFHHTLARATVAKNLLELCGGHFDRVVKVERMRKAILEGINVVYARPPIIQPAQGLRLSQLPTNILPVGCNVNEHLSRGRTQTNRPSANNNPFRELIRRPVPSRGGRLEVAGVVVGQWGANYGQPGRIQHPVQGPPRGRVHLQPQFPRANARTFQSRGTNNSNSLATRGKKTQMKATSKKKGTKKNQDENKKDAKSNDNTVEEPVNADGFSKLLTKDAKEIIPAVASKTVDNQAVEKEQPTDTSPEKDSVVVAAAAASPPSPPAPQTVKDN